MRLGIFLSHPIQYYAPWFRRLTRQMDVEVFYAYRQTPAGQARAGFDVAFEWDVPLLEGYCHRWLANVARRPGLDFLGTDTPEVYRLIREARFDAVLVFGWNRKSALQVIHACWRAGVPVFLRGDSQLQTPRSWLRKTAKYGPFRWFLPRVDAHLYVGQRNREYLQHYGVPAERLFFAPHFVDNAFFAAGAAAAVESGGRERVRAALGIPFDAFVFLFVGKLTPKKRPADLVRAVVHLQSRSAAPDAHAVLVGDGPQRPALEQFARLAAGRVHVVGFRNQTELPALYRAGDALVLPSESSETWGLVVNEAMACGLPAVVSDSCGCAPDLVDEGLTGFTYPCGNIAALADRMGGLRERCTRRRLEVQGAVAAKVRAYSMDRATLGLERALEQTEAPTRFAGVRAG